MPVPQKSLFIFENIKRERLYVSKNSNFQKLVKKGWWPEVHHIRVQHFNSLDELESELARLKDAGTKWNRIALSDAIVEQENNHDIYKDGFPVDV